MEFRFVEEKVNVLGHEDVSVEEELVAAAEGLESFEEDGSGSVVVEIGEPVITTEGEEVEMSFGLVSLETARHRGMVVPGVCGPHS
jgi:actin-like ATPase involved in cell morphogenesis